jgi:hypothetical protein
VTDLADTELSMMAICLESVVVVQVTCHCVHWIAQALGSQPRMI